ncbi:hypothetical protein HMSSN036_71900 [Paenibacillus macerans]|nr:hypothetical protein HMSSN036_71900 [Paenibacillus macerans]
MEKLGADPGHRRGNARPGTGSAQNRVNQISVESGAKTWQTFIQNELYDELWLLVHPVIASQGDKLFALADKQQSLRLIGNKTYQNGVIGLHYQK